MNRIIQIIPAPPNMFARWNLTENGEEDELSPIICLALKECEGGTFVVPMVAFENGEIEEVWEFSNYDGLCFPKYQYMEDEEN